MGGDKQSTNDSLCAALARQRLDDFMANFTGILWENNLASATSGGTAMKKQPEKERKPDHAAALAGALHEAEHLNQAVVKLCAQGMFAATLPLAERAVACRRMALGSHHRDVAASLKYLASLYVATGDYPSARIFRYHARRILEIDSRPEGVTMSETEFARTLQETAALRRAIAPAAALQKVELLMEAATDSASALQEAERLHQEAANLCGQGRLAAAIALADRTVACRQRALGPRHPDVATSLDTFADMCVAYGDSTRAQELRDQARWIRENELKPKRWTKSEAAPAIVQQQAEPLEPTVADRKAQEPMHPDLAASFDTLAYISLLNGDYARAQALRDHTLWMRGRKRRPEDLDLQRHPRQQPVEPRAPARAPPIWTLDSSWFAEQAVAAREKAKGPEHLDVATSLDELGSVLRREGYYARAESSFKRALAIREKAPIIQLSCLVRSLHNLATLYTEKGDYEQAEPLLKRILTMKEDALGPERGETAGSMQDLARLYCKKKDYANAELLFHRMLDFCDKTRGPEHPDLVVALENLAFLHTMKGDYARAEPLLQRARGIRERVLGPEHRDLAPSLLNLAFLHSTKGDHTRAEPLLRRARGIFERAPDPEQRGLVQTLCLFVIMATTRGDAEGAADFIDRATAIEDRNAGVLLASMSDEKKGAYMATLRGTTYAAISLHVRFAPEAEVAKRVALTIILRRKGRVLDAMADSFAALIRRVTASKRTDHFEGVRRSLADEIGALLDRLRSANARLSNLSWRGPGDMSLAEYRSALAELNEERQAIEAKVRRRGAQFEASVQQITIEQVQAAIPEGAALVELFRYNPLDLTRIGSRWRTPRYVAYVLHRDGDIAWVDLGDASAIEAAVERFRGALARPCTYPERAVRDLEEVPDAVLDARLAARELDSLVMEPIRGLLGSTRSIFLSPDGMLNLVPFGPLIDEDGRYLIERYSVNYLASGRDLVRLASTTPSRQRPVVVAAPDYRATPPASVRENPTRAQRSADMRGLYFHPLVFAGEEGRAVARKLPGAMLLMGEAATEEAVKALGGPLVLHIATHGFFLPDQPSFHAPAARTIDTYPRALDGSPSSPVPFENPLLRAGLALAGANHHHDGGEDGVLTALEFSQVDLIGTKLVVLSACQTGVGKAQSGDGVYGLRRAVAMAGAETQVISLWNVDDAATSDLMQSYYDHLLAGGGRSESLRQAQLAMLNRADRAHPYYWASFIVSGNPAPLNDGAPGARLRRDHGRSGPGDRL